MKALKNKSMMFLSVLLAFFLMSSGAASAATIAGNIAFEGTAPIAEPIAMDADPTCQMEHPDGVNSDEVVVNTNNTLKNVFVYIKSGLEGKTFPAPAEPVVFDQKGCAYKPKVFGVRVNQPLEILNSDATLHNVHSLSEKSPQFNLGMPLQGMKLKKTFTAPEVMVKIKCEVHPWMRAYIGVMEHPFFSVSGEEGKFELKDVPPGKYVIETWHEKYGAQTQEVEVTDAAETKDLNFSYKAA